MMNLKDKIKVGDVLSHKAWGPNIYKVQDIIGSEVKLININRYWVGWLALSSLPKGMIINGGVDEEYKPNKTAIERKIAFMQKRWEKRHEPKPTW